MKKHRRLIQYLILGAVIVVGVFTIASNAFTAKEEIPKVGGKAPNFTLENLQGESVQLDDYKGKYVVLNFWGTFCEPCVKEMPLLQNYYDSFKDKDLVVLGVNLDEPFATVSSFVRSLEVKFPIVLDNDTVRKRYGVMSYPTTFFIRPDGVIQDKVVGELIDETLSYRVHKLLSSKTGK